MFHIYSLAEDIFILALGDISNTIKYKYIF